MDILRLCIQLLGIAALLFLFFRILKPKVGTKKEQGQAVVAVLLVVFPLIVTAILDFIPKSKSEDELDRMKPMLECNLHVDRINTNIFTFHLELSNLGQTKARNVLVAYSTPAHKSIDLVRQEQAELIPGGRMTIAPDVRPEIGRAQDSTYAVKALVSFQTEESLGPRYYWSEYRFAIADSALVSGLHHYVSCHSENGPLPPQDVLSRIGFYDSIDSPVGSFMVWVKPSPSLGPAAIIQSKSMLVLYEPHMNAFVFSRFRETPAGIVGVSAAYNLDADTNTWHFIAVTWSNFTTTAWVDLISVSIPDISLLALPLSTGSSLPLPATDSGD